jgi:hypothetical protein
MMHQGRAATILPVLNLAANALETPLLAKVLCSRGNSQRAPRRPRQRVCKCGPASTELARDFAGHFRGDKSTDPKRRVRKVKFGQ